MKKNNAQVKSEFYNVRFEPDISKGLNLVQVNSRIQDGLTNKNIKHSTKTYWDIFRDNVLTFFNIFLFAIAGALLIAKKYSSLFFVVVQFSNILVGIIQDVRAKIAIEKMRLVTESKVEVLREGRTILIKNNEIVLDDLIILS